MPARNTSAKIMARFILISLPSFSPLRRRTRPRRFNDAQMSGLSSFDTSSSAASVLPAPPACPQRPRGVRHRKNRRDHSMSHHRFATGLSAVVLVVLVAGCAGPNADLFESDTGAAGPAPASELSGSWHGTFGWVGAYHYEDEARITLRIEEDGTFTATVTRNGGANNLAKATTWAGTAVWTCPGFVDTWVKLPVLRVPGAARTLGG